MRMIKSVTKARSSDVALLLTMTMTRMRMRGTDTELLLAMPYDSVNNATPELAVRVAGSAVFEPHKSQPLDRLSAAYVNPHGEGTVLTVVRLKQTQAKMRKYLFNLSDNITLVERPKQHVESRTRRGARPARASAAITTRAAARAVANTATTTRAAAREVASTAATTATSAAAASAAAASAGQDADTSRAHPLLSFTELAARWPLKDVNVSMVWESCNATVLVETSDISNTHTLTLHVQDQQGKVTFVVTNDAPASGPISIPIPFTTPPPDFSSCFLVASSNKYPGVSHTFPYPFSIFSQGHNDLPAVPSSLQMTHPSNNSVLIPGSRVNITWAGVLVSSVTILLSDHTGETTPLATVESTGFFEWTVPTTPTDYTIS